MSAALAYAQPTRRPVARPTHPSIAPPRQIEIVTTRAQRRARPKSYYAIMAVASIFLLFMGQLALSLVLSDGAYQISSLQKQQKELSRTEQDLSEKLDLLASPQSLASRAESLGMVLGTGAPVFLRLADGSLSGTATAASGSAGALGPDGGLVPNAALTAQQPTGNTPEMAASGGAPTAPSNTASVPSNGGQLPSPVTR